MAGSIKEFILSALLVAIPVCAQSDFDFDVFETKQFMESSDVGTFASGGAHPPVLALMSERIEVARTRESGFQSEGPSKIFRRPEYFPQATARGPPTFF